MGEQLPKPKKATKPYDPTQVERVIYRRWERAGVFSPAEVRPRRRRGLTSKPFVIVIPPPNVTGSLHMGHALQHTLMDLLARFHRMRGDDALLVPGTDHAGIATQNVVERELQKEGKTRQDLGREKFVERVWAWKQRYGRIIDNQMRRLGDSCDWTRYHFTMDPDYARAVQEAFLHYAQKGFIYRGERIINWCPRCASSISDLEVKHEEREGKLYYVRYPRKAVGPSTTKGTGQRSGQWAVGEDAVTIATTRPETMLGDTAVAVHPDDPRYRKQVGASVKLPLTDRTLPVIADRAVMREFGTGAVKVTPAHDHTDAEIAERHQLTSINVIGEDGLMTEAAGAYAGLSVDEARAKVLADLRAQKLVEKEEPYRLSIALCERCGTVIQPRISKQWFVKMAPLAQPAIEVVERGLITFHPARWKETYLDWLRNINDWCISRQLWWGHRLPVWYCQTGKGVGGRESGVGETRALHPTPHTRHPDGHVVFSPAKPKVCPQCGGKEFIQDPDVLDTWFSSALWPFAVLGWPDATADLKRFYPTSVLTTAPEILYLWVARMVFSGLEFLDGKKYLPARHYGKRTPAQRIPFRDVIIHSTVLTLRGKRMSKSKGTGVDPLALIDTYGADATRFGLLLQLHADQQALRFDENAIRAARNFVNKLWNISRYLQGTGSRVQGVGARRARFPTPYTPHPTPFDVWILSRLSETTKTVTDALTSYRFGEAARALHAFVWDEFADWYIEMSKVPGATSAGTAQTMFTTILRLLQPFTPFVTEVLWQDAGQRGFVATAPWPVFPARAAAGASERQVRALQDVVRDIRAARALLGIPAGTKLRVRLTDEKFRTVLSVIEFLAGAKSVEVGRPGDEWVPIPVRGRGGFLLHRADLSGVNVRARLADAEKEHAAFAARVRTVEDRLRAMRGKAAAAAVAQQEALLRELISKRQEHDAALGVLRTLAERLSS